MSKPKSLVELVQEKTGLGQEQAQGAIDTVIDFLKEKLPAPIAGQLDTILGSDVSGIAGQVDSVLGTLGGLFGKKE